MTMLGILDSLNPTATTVVGSGTNNTTTNTSTTRDEQCEQEQEQEQQTRTRARARALHLSFLRSLSAQDRTALCAEHHLREDFFSSALDLLINTPDTPGTDTDNTPDIPGTDTASSSSASSSGAQDFLLTTLPPLAVAQLTTAWTAHMRRLLRASGPYVMCLEAADEAALTASISSTSSSRSSESSAVHVPVVLYKPNW